MTRTVRFLTLAAPFTGAWIETRQKLDQSPDRNAAPFTGAWIET